MKSFLKDWIVPPGYIKLLNKTSPKVNLPEIAQVPPKLVDTSLNIRFKDIHKGEECFILASGPSIAQQDLRLLRNKITIAVSHFHLHKDIKTIRPRYHVLAPQHAPFNFNDSSRYFEDFINVYNPEEMDIFLGVTRYPFNYLNLIASTPRYNLKNIHYLNYERYVELNEQNYLLEPTWDIASDQLFSMRTVIYGAIQVAVYMGFSTIYLLGCDHDYLNDISRVTNHHFYEEEKGISDHKHLSEITMEKWFYEYYMRWKQYRVMNEYAKTKDIKILNATEGGMLDVFPRINYINTL